ncbi:MAG: hypothetical protein EXQ52_18560 [Bryobacterales bacterium]|nr:hypothetical protein [Bryobacterales bacterium]
MKKYIAEFVGTFLLALVVGLSLSGKFPSVPTPVLAAITVAACVFTMGAICGTHINPTITIALLSVGKIGVKDALGYLVAQFAAGGAANLASNALLNGARPTVVAVDSGAVFIAEVLGAFCLAYGVASVAFGKAPGATNGLTIGGSLLFGLSIAAAIGSNAVLNPAVAVGLSCVSVVYLTAPIVGGVIAMQLYKFVQSE